MAKGGFWAIESGEIRFGKDGHWYSDEDLIENARISALFSKQLQRRDNGEWWIVMGDEQAPVTIEDTPWVVTRVDGNPDQGFTLGLNDGSQETLDPDRLRFSSHDVLYGDAPGHHCQVRFLRAPQIELLSHAVEQAGAFILPGPNGSRSTLRVVEKT